MFGAVGGSPVDHGTSAEGAQFGHHARRSQAAFCKGKALRGQPSQLVLLEDQRQQAFTQRGQIALVLLVQAGSASIHCAMALRGFLMPPCTGTWQPALG